MGRLQREARKGQYDNDNGQDITPPDAPTRWVVPAGGSASFWVKFLSDSVGRVDQTLGFEVVGGGVASIA